MISLEWLWFLGLSLVTSASGRWALRSDEEALMVAGLCAAACAYAGAWWLAWPVLGGPLVDRLDMVIIEPGSAAHTATVALLLAGLVAAGGWVLVFVGGTRKAGSQAA